MVLIRLPVTQLCLNSESLLHAAVSNVSRADVSFLSRRASSIAFDLKVAPLSLRDEGARTLRKAIVESFA